MQVKQAFRSAGGKLAVGGFAAVFFLKLGAPAFGQQQDSSLFKRDSIKITVPVKQDSVPVKKLEDAKIVKGTLVCGNDSVDLSRVLYMLTDTMKGRHLFSLDSAALRKHLGRIKSLQAPTDEVIANILRLEDGKGLILKLGGKLCLVERKDTMLSVCETSNYSEDRNTVKIEARQEGVGKVFYYIFGGGTMKVSMEGNSIKTCAATYGKDDYAQHTLSNGNLVVVANDGTVAIFSPKGVFRFNYKDSSIFRSNGNDSLQKAITSNDSLKSHGDSMSKKKIKAPKVRIMKNPMLRKNAVLEAGSIGIEMNLETGECRPYFKIKRGEGYIKKYGKAFWADKI